MITEHINLVLELVGALSLGYLTYRLVKYLLTKIKWGNPLKIYVRKIVLEYLNELKQE